MTSIARQEFLDHFAGGVSLTQINPRSLELNRHDSDGDGELQGSELAHLFRHMDRFDRDGSPHTLELSGRAGEIFSALSRGRRAPPDTGAAIRAAARWRLQTMAPDYAVDSAPTSPHPGLSHNRQPGITRLSWLRGQWKCNQFVGDVLAQARVAMPVHQMRGGGVHYMQAEALPHQRRHFTRLERLDQLKAGDLVVIDWAAHGAGTAHTEIFSEVELQRGGIRSIGAHAAGVTEEQGWRPIGDWYDALRRATADEHSRRWELDQYTIYLLRPIRALRE